MAPFKISLRIVAAVLLCLCHILAPTASSAQSGINPSQVEVFREYKNNLADVIWVRINNIDYRSASGGTATIEVVFDRSGSVQRSRVVATSGSPYLDSLALQTLRPGAEFVPIPAGIGVKTVKVTFPIRFLRRP